MIYYLYKIDIKDNCFNIILIQNLPPPSPIKIHHKHPPRNIGGSRPLHRRALLPHSAKHHFSANKEIATYLPCDHRSGETKTTASSTLSAASLQREQRNRNLSPMRPPIWRNPDNGLLAAQRNSSSDFGQHRPGRRNRPGVSSPTRTTNRARLSPVQDRPGPLGLAWQGIGYHLEDGFGIAKVGVVFVWPVMKYNSLMN